MISKIPINFLIIFSSFLSQNVEAFEVEAVEICRYLYSVKGFDKLRQLAKIIHSPIGRYYEVLAEDNWKKPADFDISGVSNRYRPRVLLSTGQALRHTGDYALARSLIKEAGTLAEKQRDLLTLYHVQKEAAIDKSLAGDHQGSLHTLENSRSLINRIGRTHKGIYFDYHNSLAVELNELERLEEARQALDIALASPFSKVYPEWHQTRMELEEQNTGASRSIVFVNPPEVVDNVVVLPRRPERQALTLPSSTARILNYERRVTMTDTNQKPKKNPHIDESERARVDEKLGVLFRRLYHPDTELTEQMVDELLRMTEPAQPEEESK